MMPIKADPSLFKKAHHLQGVALSMVCLDSARVWLSYQAKNWILILGLLCLVFANPVTFRENTNAYLNMCVFTYRNMCMLSLHALHFAKGDKHVIKYTKVCLCIKIIHTCMTLICMHNMYVTLDL